MELNHIQVNAYTIIEKLIYLWKILLLFSDVAGARYFRADISWQWVNRFCKWFSCNISENGGVIWLDRISGATAHRRVGERERESAGSGADRGGDFGGSSDNRHKYSPGFSDLYFARIRDLICIENLPCATHHPHPPSPAIPGGGRKTTLCLAATRTLDCAHRGVC